MLRKVLPLILLVVASAMANAEKVSGFVKGSPTGKSFTLGAKGGPYTVDASKAKITMKGKFFSISGIKGGSQATVEGTMKGKTIMATSVNIGYIPGEKKAGATTKAAGAAAAGAGAAAMTKGKGMKDKMKDKMSGMKDKMSGMKDKMKDKMKGMKKPASKPKVEAKPKMTAKPKSTAKPKDNSKMKSTGKAKTDTKGKAKAGDKAADKAKTGN